MDTAVSVIRRRTWNMLARQQRKHNWRPRRWLKQVRIAPVVNWLITLQCWNILTVRFEQVNSWYRHVFKMCLTLQYFLRFAKYVDLQRLCQVIHEFYEPSRICVNDASSTYKIFPTEFSHENGLFDDGKNRLSFVICNEREVATYSLCSRSSMPTDKWY